LISADKLRVAIDRLLFDAWWEREEAPDLSVSSLIRLGRASTISFALSPSCTVLVLLISGMYHGARNWSTMQASRLPQMRSDLEASNNHCQSLLILYSISSNAS
jgi:hypothetical protein